MVKSRMSSVAGSKGVLRASLQVIDGEQVYIILLFYRCL
jgi:hypothetical protein